MSMIWRALIIFAIVAVLIHVGQIITAPTAG
jgi:hypothetical protein